MIKLFQSLEVLFLQKKEETEFPLKLKPFLVFIINISWRNASNIYVFLMFAKEKYCKIDKTGFLHLILTDQKIILYLIYPVSDSLNRL